MVLERKPPFRSGELFVSFRKMDLADRCLIGDQLMLLPDGFGERIVHTGKDMLDRVGNVCLYHLSGQSFGQRIDRPENIRLVRSQKAVQCQSVSGTGSAPFPGEHIVLTGFQSVVGVIIV